MVRGRKKSSYNVAQKTIYMADTTAWEICKKKGINLSKEITRLVQGLAYTQNLSRLKQTRAVLIGQMQGANAARDKEIGQIENKYEAEVRILAMKINKLTDIEAEGMVKEVKIMKIEVK